MAQECGQIDVVLSSQTSLTTKKTLALEIDWLIMVVRANLATYTHSMWKTEEEEGEEQKMEAEEEMGKKRRRKKRGRRRKRGRWKKKRGKERRRKKRNRMLNKTEIQMVIFKKNFV